MNTKEIYLTKEELISFLEDRKINRIRIVAENDTSLKRKRGGSIKATSTMIDIVSTEKEKEEEPVYKKEWKNDKLKNMDSSLGGYNASTVGPFYDDAPY
jgi:hypothetical protein